MGELEDTKKFFRNYLTFSRLKNILDLLDFAFKLEQRTDFSTAAEKYSLGYRITSLFFGSGRIRSYEVFGHMLDSKKKHPCLLSKDYFFKVKYDI